MAKRAIVQNFSNFNGINQSLNQLTRTPEYAASMQNFIALDDGSIGLRQGEKPVSCRHEAGSQGMFLYTYPDDQNGTTIEEVLGIDAVGNLWKAKQGSVAVLSSTGTTATWSLYANGNGYTLDVKQDGVIVHTEDCGNGLLDTDLDILTLKASLVAHGVTLTITPYGLANGAQVSVGNSANLVLRAGHTISLGDYVRIGANYRQITYVSGNNVRWAAGADLTFADNDVITFKNSGGYSIPVAALPLVIDDNIKTSKTYTFFYWTLVTNAAAGYNRYTGSTSPFGSMRFLDTDAQKFSSVQVNNCIYFGGPYRAYDSTNAFNGTVKYDGQMVSLAGLPRGVLTKTSTSTSGALTQLGTYRWLVTLWYKDARGNIIESPASSGGSNPMISEPLTYTLTGADDSVALKYQSAFTASGRGTKFPINGGVVSGTQVGVTTDLLLTDAHTIRPGDRILISDHSGTSVALVERTVIGLQNHGGDCDVFLEDEGAFDVVDGEVVSAGLKVRCWRTTANNLTYYLEHESLLDISSTYELDYDSLLADTAIQANEQLVLADLNRDPDPPPPLKCITEHQGSLVGIGRDVTDNDRSVGSDDYRISENDVYYSLPGEPEAIPVASGYFSVPTTTRGTGTAITSAGDSTLLVFKERSFYKVLGDLDTGTYQLIVGAENDVGCPSQDSICKVKDAVLFVSNKGPQLFAGGELATGFNQKLISYFRNNDYTAATSGDFYAGASKLALKRAVCFNDADRQSVIIFVPVEGGTVGTRIYPTVGSKGFLWNYAKEAWGELVWGNTNYVLNPYRGMFYSGGSLYLASTYFNAQYLTLRSQLMARLNAQTDYDFSSAGYALQGAMRTHWETLESPAVWEQYLKIKVYSFRDTLNTMYLKVKSYLGFDETNISATRDLTFSSTTSLVQQSAKLASAKATGVQFLFENKDSAGSYVVNKNCVISGYEVIAALGYDSDDLEK